MFACYAYGILSQKARFLTDLDDPYSYIKNSQPPYIRPTRITLLFPYVS